MAMPQQIPTHPCSLSLSHNALVLVFSELGEQWCGSAILSLDILRGVESSVLIWKAHASQ